MQVHVLDKRKYAYTNMVHTNDIYAKYMQTQQWHSVFREHTQMKVAKSEGKYILYCYAKQYCAAK